MPRIIAQDDYSTTVADDAGNVMVVPRGVGPDLPLDQSGALGIVAPGAPANDFLPGMIARMHGTDLPPPVTKGTGAEPDYTAPPPPPIQAPATPPQPIASGPDQVIPAPAQPPKAKPQKPLDAFGQANQDYMGALGVQADAVQQAANAQAAQAADQANALAQRNHEMELTQARFDAARAADAQNLADLNGKYDTAVKDYANSKEDDSRWWHSRTTSQKIFAGIGVALSGLGQALKHQGGTNPALDMINKAMREDVAEQLRNRDFLRDQITTQGAAIDRFRQMTGDKTAAYQLQMASANERAARQVELVAQKYAGPQAQAHGQLLAGQLRQQGAEWLDKAAQAGFQRQQEQERTGLEYAAQQEHKREFNLEQGLHEFDRAQEMAFNASQAAARAAPTPEKAKAIMEMAQQQRALSVPAPPQAVIGNDGKPVIDPVTKQPKVTVAPLTNSDGSPFTAYTPEDAKDLRAEYSATAQYANDVDKLVALRNEAGSEEFKTEASRKMKELHANLLLDLQQLSGIMRINKDTLDVYSKQIGTDDPTEFRGVIDALIAGRDNVVDHYNTSLQTKGGYDGPRVDFKSTTDMGSAQDTKESKRLRDLINYVPGKGDIRTNNAGGFDNSDPNIDRGFSSEQQQYINLAADTASSASSDPNAREQAKAQLESVAKSAASPGFRALAEDALKRVEAGTWQQGGGVNVGGGQYTIVQRPKYQ